MSELTLFYVAFIIQILLLSIYFPRRILSRMRYVMTNYPESTHPKLYPQSINVVEKLRRNYFVMNAFNVCLGLLILFFIYKGSLIGEEGVNPMLPWAYFMIQMLASMYLEFKGFKFAKMMKRADTRRNKSADLQPRKFFDYMSPMLFVAVLAAYIASVGFVFYLEENPTNFPNTALLLSLILLVGYVVFFTVISWMVYGKKCDPYQSQKDRVRTTKLAIQTQGYVLIAVASFLSFSAANKVYQFNGIMPVAMSVYLQILVVISMGYMLQKNRLKDIDFDVYKAQ